MTAPADVGPEADWQERLLRKGKGKLDAVAANAITILRNTDEWRGVIAYDAFRGDVTSTKPPPWHPDDAPTEPKAGPWSGADITRLQSWLRRKWSLTLSGDAVKAALLVVAEANTINPVADWLDGLAWDATARVDTWLSTYLGAEDSDYTRSVGRWFLISAVARAFDPGCKVDTVPVLEGAQGLRKSQAVKALFAPWASDTPIELDSKDRFVVLRGVWGYEIAEFDGYSKHDATTLKAFTSSPSDNYRAPFAATNADHPRRCVFVATVNPGRDYLVDETGGRRWWPVRVGVTGPIQVEALRAARDAIWAEARELYLSHRVHVASGSAEVSPYRWWPETGEEHALVGAEQADRQSRDAWDGPVASWLALKPDGASVALGDVLEHLGLERGKWDPASQQRAGRCLRVAGWVKKRARVGDGLGYVYQRVRA